MSATINLGEATAILNGILMRLEDPVTFYDYVGRHEVAKVKRRIQYTKIDPSGKPWLPWAPFTANKRDYLGNFAQGIMWDTGKLLNSIEFQVDGAFGVDIGTDVWYAAKHQDGEGRIPQREIFGWDDATIPQLAAVYVAFLEKGMI